MKKRVTAFLFAMCLLFAFPVAAYAAEQYYVVDEAGLLTDTEKSELTQRASAISQQYACGVYIAVLEDFTEGGYTDILECAKEYYRNNDLGVGEGRDGELLMLSMEDRDFALIAYGNFGNASFTDYGKEVLEDEFLDDFADDNWYDGFSDYLDKSEEMLALSQDGTPLDVGSDPDAARRSMGTNLAIVIVVPCLIAGVVCLIFRMQMRTVHAAPTARDYIAADAVALTLHTDMYTHTTETRTKIHKDSDSGGTSVGSDGFSGDSGKF